MLLANLYNWLLLLIRRSYAAGRIYTIACYYDFFFFFFLLLFFCPRFLQILGQTHDEMENGKGTTHIFESVRASL